MTHAGPDADVVRRRVSLPDLIPELKPAGRDRYRGCCSFHAERTPSMVVNRWRGVWRFRCFGCGAAGDSIDYVMRRDQVDFRAALRQLGGEAGPEMPLPPPVPNWRLTCDARGCRASRTVEATTYGAAYAEALSHGWRTGKADDERMYCPGCQLSPKLSKAGPHQARRSNTR